MFAYGVTGSGKTHTMIGTPSQEGILIRSVKRILLQLGEKSKASCFRLWEDTNADGSEPTLDVSFFEIYNNHCYDLFDSKQSELQVRSFTFFLFHSPCVFLLGFLPLLPLCLSFNPMRCVLISLPLPGSQVKDDGVAPAVIPDLTKLRVKSAEDFQVFSSSFFARAQGVVSGLDITSCLNSERLKTRKQRDPRRLPPSTTALLDPMPSCRCISTTPRMARRTLGPR